MLFITLTNTDTFKLDNLLSLSNLALDWVADIEIRQYEKILWMSAIIKGMICSFVPKGVKKTERFYACLNMTTTLTLQYTFVS